jgi:hypothetical protein
MYLAVISVTRVGTPFSLQSLTDCSFIFQSIIHAGLLKKGLCAVQDESAGQLVIISRRRNNCETIISKVSLFSFLLFYLED